MLKCFASILLYGSLAGIAAAQNSAEKISFSFADTAHAQQLLGKPDAFVKSMSPFDRAARLKTSEAVNEAQYLQFVSANILTWSDEEKARIGAVLKELQPQLAMLALPESQAVIFIKTSGQEEGNAAYTRSNAIILPAKLVAAENSEELKSLISHELWHILSRYNPGLKQRMYAVIGFQPCGELRFPHSLAAQKLTNPDAPDNDYCIRINSNATETWAIPILFSRSASYDTTKGGEFFDYLEFKLLLVEKAPSATGHPNYNQQDLHLIDAGTAGNFFEQIGKNTEYIIHPEEIVADNVALLLTGAKRPASPQVLEKMKEILMLPPR